MGFAEIADRVWVARHEWLDVTTTVVGGTDGLVLVDTLASVRAGRELVADVRALGAGEVVHVVNTHDHFDHCFGNVAVRETWADVPIHAHEDAGALMDAALERGEPHDLDRRDPRSEEVRTTTPVPADVRFSSATAIDLGDRYVELVHPGRGHTAGDVVVRVPDVDVVIAGDLVEESQGNDAVPGFGADCYPLEWPLALDNVLNLSTTSSVVVPGHGAPVDREYVEDQRNAIGIVAETIRDLAGRGVAPADALAAADAWPYPRELLVHAVARGFEHLPRSQRRLPLV